MSSGLTIGRFSPEARKIVCGVLKPANYRKADRADTTDLLASMAASETKSGEALRHNGITYGEVMTYLTYHKQKFGRDISIPTGDEDFDLGQIFSTDAKKALTNAIALADFRDKSEVTGGELFDILVGGLDLRESENPLASQTLIKRIADELGITTGDLRSTLNNLQSQSLSLAN